MLAFHKIHRLKWKLEFSLPLCNDTIFLINYIWNLRNKSYLMFTGSSIEVFSFSVIYIFDHFFSMQDSFYRKTFIFSLNFSNIEGGSLERPFAMENLHRIYFQIQNDQALKICVGEPVQNMHDPAKIPFQGVSPLETAGFLKILLISAISMGKLQVFTLILENLLFPCITAIF